VSLPAGGSSKAFAAMWRVEKDDDTAPARAAEDPSFTCKCGRWWASRATETADGCMSCAPESSWKFDETRRAVALKPGTTLGPDEMRPLLDLA
jgi:hypothetical protein